MQRRNLKNLPFTFYYGFKLQLVIVFYIDRKWNCKRDRTDDMIDGDHGKTG